MAEPDIAIVETDDLLARLEKDIHATYSQAQEEMDKKLKKFMADFERKNEAKLALVSSGKLSQSDYETWLKNQAYQKQWYESMVQTLSEDMVRTDQKAMSITNGFTPEAYAINHNYAAFEVESGSLVDANFMLYDRNAVERILKDYPDLLPTPSPDVVADLAWHRKKVGNAVLQGILQGESIPKIAKRLSDVTGMDDRAAVRNARTAMTGAQNAGRVDAYKQAQDIGIELEMEWNATLDGRTRDSHRMLDGERREPDEQFSNECRYPADPQGPSHEIYNCRCYLRAVVKGSDQSARQRLGRIPEGITYEEWKSGKKFAEPEGKRSETYRMINMTAEQIPTMQSTQTPSSIESELIKKSLGEDNYKEFMGLVSNAPNGFLYEEYADTLSGLEQRKGAGVYRPLGDAIEYDLESHEGMNKYATLAHEYGHAFDAKIGATDLLTYSEADAVNTFLDGSFVMDIVKKIPSSSDEFLTAMRSDMTALLPSLRDGTLRNGLLESTITRNSTSGVQDVLDGFYSTQDNGVLPWGHGNKYYNRFYNHRIKGVLDGHLKKVYNELGMDASNQEKVKAISRHYEAASELWANMSSAVTCGGAELEAMKKYMPNTHRTYLDILNKLNGGN